MRNTYVKEGILKLPRPRQFYEGFAATGHGSWSRTQYLKYRSIHEAGKPKQKNN